MDGRDIALLVFGRSVEQSPFMTVRQACCALILLAGVLAGGPARADFTLESAYPETPLKGPQAAAGAVLWNHGMNFLFGTEASTAPVPVFIALLRNAGFDVFRLLRPRMEEEPRSAAAAIAATADRLAGEGYRKIVLAGQSAGAWLSLMAASRSDHIYAVIANAPAYYGVNHPAYLKNGFILLDHLGDIRHGRIMISYFKDDPYDPGGRGPASEEVLTDHRLPHLVIDRPDGFSGHFSGNSVQFMRRFGACVLAVAGDGPMPARRGCETEAALPGADQRR